KVVRFARRHGTLRADISDKNWFLHVRGWSCMTLDADRRTCTCILGQMQMPKTDWIKS
ncbi:unnamed protein product, partial [Porites evermanni]